MTLTDELKRSERPRANSTSYYPRDAEKRSRRSTETSRNSYRTKDYNEKSGKAREPYRRSYHSRDSAHQLDRSIETKSDVLKESNGPKKPVNITSKAKKPPGVQQIIDKILQGQYNKCNVVFRYGEHKIHLDSEIDFEKLEKQALNYHVNFQIIPSTTGMSTFTKCVKKKLLTFLLRKRRKFQVLVQFHQGEDAPRHHVDKKLYFELNTGKMGQVKTILLRPKPKQEAVIPKKLLEAQKSLMLREHRRKERDRIEWENIQKIKDPRIRKSREDGYKEYRRIKTPEIVKEAIQSNELENEEVRKTVEETAKLQTRMITLFGDE